MQVMTFSTQQYNRTLICSIGTKREHLPILQFYLRVFNILGLKKIEKSFSTYLSWDIFLVVIWRHRWSFANSRLQDGYIQILMSCLSTHPITHPTDGMQKKQENARYFLFTLNYLSSFGGQITVTQILARSQRVKP